MEGVAYWLELNPCSIITCTIPHPALRNSFLVLKRNGKKNGEAGIPITEIFKPEEELTNELVKRESYNQLGLEKEIAEANQYYEHLKTLSGTIDPSLSQHVESFIPRP